MGASPIDCEEDSIERPAWYWWLLIPLGMGLTGVLAISPDAHAWWSANVTRFTPRALIGGIFVWAALLHVYKGMKAVRIAERAGLDKTSMGWGWQTFLLGFASLGLLEKKVAQAEDRGHQAIS